MADLRERWRQFWWPKGLRYRPAKPARPTPSKPKEFPWSDEEVEEFAAKWLKDRELERKMKKGSRHL